MESTQDSIHLHEYTYACKNDGSSQSDSESVSGTSSLSNDGGQELARCEVGIKGFNIFYGLLSFRY